MTSSSLLLRFLTRPPEHRESVFFSLDAMEASPFAKEAARRAEGWEEMSPVRQVAWVLLYGRALDHAPATIDLMLHLREWYLALEEPEANEQTLKRLWREACTMPAHAPTLTLLFYPVRFMLAFPPGEPSREGVDEVGRSLQNTVRGVLAGMVGLVEAPVDRRA